MLGKLEAADKATFDDIKMPDLLRAVLREVHEVGCCIAHAPRAARRVEASAPAREGHEDALLARRARHTGRAARQDAAVEIAT